MNVKAVTVSSALATAECADEVSGVNGVRLRGCKCAAGMELEDGRAELRRRRRTEASGAETSGAETAKKTR